MAEPDPIVPPARRSDATKATILAAARAQFAALGYQATTIRAVANAAEIDPAMVMRYFGNKEGLFAAAADFDLRLPDLAGVPRDALGAALVAHFLDRWEDDETLMALLRTASTNEAAAARMQALFSSQMAPLIARLSGDSRAGAAARAGLIASQVLGLALCRYVLKLPPVVALKRPEIVRRIGATVQSYLFDA
ncbi:MAG TPA: TetR family transcriptional regulator [Variovorax sp.]|jgi:AcrR family transcriptional regulator|nr:TetR family transcriptional regulator [Variovorax sp.]